MFLMRSRDGAGRRVLRPVRIAPGGASAHAAPTHRASRYSEPSRSCDRAAPAAPADTAASLRPHRVAPPDPAP